VREKPEEKGKSGAQEEACDDGEIKCGVFAAMDDVAGKFAKTERQPGAEIEKCADENKETTEEQEPATEFAEWVHETDCSEGKRGKEVMW
jgi:hypothetical protein